MQATYAEFAEDEVGLRLAERLARLGLQPFNVASILRASRQVEVILHHQRLLVHASAELRVYSSLKAAPPLPPLPGTTRVLLVMCGISERDDQQCVRDLYPNLAAELCCDGSHVHVCLRCATNGEPAFTASLASFLRAIEAKPTLGESGAAGSSGASRVAQPTVDAPTQGGAA
jgi:hypothetical protein